MQIKDNTLYVDGPVTPERTVELDELVMELCRQDFPEIVVDITKTTYLCSIARGALLAAHFLLNSSKRKLMLRLTKESLPLIEFARLDKIFNLLIIET